MKLDPAERFLTLSQLVDDLPDDETSALVRHLSGAFFAVVRHMRGTATEAEARFAVTRARDSLESAVRASAGSAVRA